MSVLVERLRYDGFWGVDRMRLCAEAADEIERLTAERNPQPARKIGGSYQADGAVVARFQTRAGLERVVFEFNEPKGMLHIFTPEQIEMKP